MHQYGVKDVERLLRIPRSTLRALVTAGFVSPARGPRKAWIFSFQDLIVLRTARALAEAKVPRRRIIRSVKELRRHLPAAMPLSGLSIGAVGERVVVKEGARRWQAESGQYLLAFEADPADGSLSVVQSVAEASPPADAQAWFERGAALERADPQAARRAYEHSIALDRSRVDARLNLGSLLHERGLLEEAAHAYLDALKACGSEAMLLYNFGVLLEDMGHPSEAIRAYEQALRGNPALADAHFNLALLCEQAGRPKEAIRHMSQYRRLATSS